MLNKIAITGPESTGKSWLANQLARYYQAVWVPEYAREYLGQIHRPYKLADVEAIAAGQIKAVEVAALSSKTKVFSDTEALVCKIWAEVVYGTCPKSIEDLLQKQSFDYYLLCDIDLPWEPDPMREHPHRRAELFERYKKALNELGWPYAVVSGQDNIRLENAVRMLEESQNRRFK